MEDGFLAGVEGRQGLPEAMAAVVPQTQVQRCLVPTVRNSLQEVPWQERQVVAADRRALDGAATLVEAAQALERCAERWETKDPTSSPRWLAAWDRLTGLFDSPLAIRRVLETPNAIESLHDTLRQRRKTHGVFPNDESIVQLVSVARQNSAKRWTRPMRDGKAALHQFVILFGERVPV